jgi:hypothetical protein
MAAKKIRQMISAGNNFTGIAPEAAPVVDDGTLKTYAEEAVGGEFTPGAGNLRRIFLTGGNQSSVEFKVVFGVGGEEQLLVCPCPDRQVRWDGDLVLAADDKVIVTTKNADYAMSCDVICL